MSANTSCRIEAEEIARNLPVGDRTDHYQCPVCNGGDTGEKSFIVFRDENGYGWVCYRASCSASGYTPDLAGLHPAIDKQQRVLTPYAGRTKRLTRAEEAFLRKKVGFTKVHLKISKVQRAADTARYVFPILSPSGERRGVVLRSWEMGDRPKAVNRLEKDEPSLSWYLGHAGKPLVIVEDIPSAVRMSLYYNCVALCGCSAPERYINEIRKYAKDIIWILDFDAAKKSMQQMKTNRLLFRSNRCHIIQKDIKDMTEDALLSLVKQLNKKQQGDENTNDGTTTRNKL